MFNIIRKKLKLFFIYKKNLIKVFIFYTSLKQSSQALRIIAYYLSIYIQNTNNIKYI